MKTATVLFGLLFVYVTVDAGNLLVDTINRGLRECSIHLLPNQDTISMVEKFTHIENRGANCLRACALNAIGFMNNTKLVIPNVLGVLHAMEDTNPETIKNWTKMMTYCKRIGETTEDRCDVAGNYLKCLSTILVDGSKEYLAETIPFLQKMLLATIM